MTFISNRISEQENIGDPFETMESAWFWFIAANNARVDGARVSAGIGKGGRPCEVSDIISILDRLHRNRILTMDHLRVLKFYGERGYAPDKAYRKERRAFYQWKEALNKMRPVFERKKIVRKQGFNFFGLSGASLPDMETAMTPSMEGAY